MAGWAFDLNTGPGFVVTDMLATLRTGEFQVGHKVPRFQPETEKWLFVITAGIGLI
jgi:hypothetical protein